MTFGRRFLCSSDAHSMLGNELSTLGAGHVAARAAVAAASSSGQIWTDDRNVAWCTLRCPTVDGEGQYELGIDARCATASPASPASAFDTPPCTPSHACQSLKPSRLFDRMLAGDAGSWTIQLVHLELVWNLPYFGASALLGPLPCLAAGLVYLARAGDVGMGGSGGSGTPCVGCW